MRKIVLSYSHFSGFAEIYLIHIQEMMTKNSIDSVSMILPLYIYSGQDNSEFVVEVRAHSMYSAYRSDRHYVSVRMVLYVRYSR